MPNKKKAVRAPHAGYNTAQLRELAFQRLADWFAARSGDADAERNLAVALEGEPVVTPALQRVGLPKVLEALRASDDEDAAAFVEVYDSRPASDKRYLSWEAIAVAADIGSKRLFEVAASALREYGATVSTMLLSHAMPEIVAKSIKVAKTTKGVDDRMAMLKAGAIVPIPKGSQIALQINAGAVQAALPEEQPTSWDQERQLRELHDAWGDRKALPAGGLHTSLPAEVDAIQKETTAVLEDLI